MKPPMSPRLALAALLVLAGAAAAQTVSQPRARPEDLAVPDRPSRGAAASRLTDAEILGVLTAVDQVEFQAAHTALARSEHPGIVELAEQLLIDHTALGKDVMDVVERLDLRPAEGAVTKRLRAEGYRALRQLDRLRGRAFERAYVEHGVSFHQLVLQTLDSTLLPGAQAEAVRALLTQVRPLVVRHLEHSRAVQRALANAPAPERAPAHAAPDRSASTHGEGSPPVLPPGRAADRTVDAAEVGGSREKRGGPDRPPPTDAQAAELLRVAGQAEVDAGKLALEKSQSPEVRRLAEQMVREHTAALQKAAQLLGDKGPAPQASETSRELGESVRARLERLRRLEGSDFDRAYTANEVVHHRAVIGMVDSTLLPSVKSAPLRALLEEQRPALVTHLRHARELQRALARPATSRAPAGTR